MGNRRRWHHHVPTDDLECLCINTVGCVLLIAIVLFGFQFVINICRRYRAISSRKISRFSRGSRWYERGIRCADLDLARACADRNELCSVFHDGCNLVPLGIASVFLLAGTIERVTLKPL